jgi:uncharacterized secreted protein with C-terminal beta-propeller domain
VADNLGGNDRQPDERRPDDINSWLQSVRPAATPDDDWTASPAAEEMLAAVHRQIEAGGLRRTAGKGTVSRIQGRIGGRRSWLAAGAGLAAAAVVLALFVRPAGHGSTGTAATAASPATGIVTLPPGPTIRPAALLLRNYSSCAQLVADLRSHTAASVTSYGLPGLQRSYDLNKAVQGALPNAAGSDSAAGSSTTNDQEVGVDEPDIVKTDVGDTGKVRLVTITDGKLRVIDAANKSVTGSLDLSIYAGWQDAQLLVAGDHALVLLGGGTSGGISSPGGFYGLPARGIGTPGARSSYLFVDLAGQPKVTGSLRASGSYLDARLVGSTVRLVVRSGPVISFPNSNGSVQSTAANQRIVRGAPLSAWLPSYSITTGTASTEHTVPCEQVSHPAEFSGASMLTVYTLDLGQLGAGPQPVSVAADGDTVYASASSLYIASNPGWFCCLAAVSAQRTEIHRFDISGTAQPVYLGSGSVPGRLLSQYSLSEYAGSLRIATTGGQGSAAESSGVYVLNSNTLKTTGQVVGLGRTEQIYAVRFVGPVAYLVTFRQTDPLYVIDLHNPAAPKLAGALQLTGYSNYLHDAGDSRLIGVGQEASSEGLVAGLQVSLFDVSKPAQPTRIGHVVRSDAPGEQALDPHAFLYWQPTGLVVVPVQSWASAQSGKVLVLRVSGSRLNALGLLANPLTPGTADDGLGIQRSLVVNGVLWTVSGSGVQLSNPSTLARQAWIPFG